MLRRGAWDEPEITPKISPATDVIPIADARTVRATISPAEDIRRRLPELPAE